MNSEDKRKGSHLAPTNKLTKEEVVRVSTSVEYVDLAPTQIVPLLADKGIYLASESSYYNFFLESKLLAHRGKSKKKSNKRPAPLIAKGPTKFK